MNVHAQAFFDLVNIIRENANVFLEWHTFVVAPL